MSGNNGIPYGIIDSIGEFMVKDGKVTNYEDFCNELIDKQKRIKFLNLIRFRQNISLSAAKENKKSSLEKLEKTYQILRDLNCYSMSGKSIS